ncbi:MAG TPA: hypothetical protein VEN81_10350 [Planctomycetota bacterium]|nr:hypothetical protein [Planctomycetota bacterium]
MMMLAPSLLLLASALAQETSMEETEFVGDVAKVVRAYEGAEKLSKTDPRAALAQLEEKVLSSLPRTFETTIVVRFSKGATKGAEKERHAFYPYRLAGECALGSDLPDRAVEYLKKSPSSQALLEKAIAAQAEKARKPAPAPASSPAAPAPAAPKPSLALEPFFERHDFVGALEALRKERDGLGTDYDRLVRQVQLEAVRHARAAAALLAGSLPRLFQASFAKDHLEPCLASVAGVPADLDPEELRWVRRLARWTARPEGAELDALALAALKFDADYHVMCELAQQARLSEVEKLVEEARHATGADRQGILERLDGAERAFRRLSEAKPSRELGEALSRALARLPIDSDRLAEARRGVATVREVRVLARALEQLWISPDRARLGDQDQKDLALYLGIYRASALFLDGKSVAECAEDPRIREVFQNAPPLPPTVSPKIAAVRSRVAGPR